MPLRYFVVDAFTDRPFAGNPAAVIPLRTWRDVDWLHSVAMEMNLSDTAYLVPNHNGFDLRWFTPKMEVDLCGHATLAASLVLAEQGLLVDGQDVAFSTRSGILTASLRGDCFQLDFPLTPAQASDPPADLIESLGVEPLYMGKTQFDFLVEVESEAMLRDIAPDFNRLASVPCRGAIVTARASGARYDFVSRFFAPAAGIDEDPVTGSAHCCLADYWGKRLNKTRLVGFQASARGGVVHVDIRSDRVMLGGQGVIVARGELLVD